MEETIEKPTFELRKLNTLDVKKGDVLVLSYHRPLRLDHAKLIKDRIQEAFPGTRAIILEDGMEIGVVSRSELEGRGRGDL